MYRALLLAFALHAAFAAQAQVPPYVSGGIGAEERAALLPHRSDFNLQLTFAARRSGNYLAGVEVSITDGHGIEVLRAESKGPFFFAQLVPDTYTVRATFQGETQTRRVKVGPAGAATLALYWEER